MKLSVFLRFALPVCSLVAAIGCGRDESAIEELQSLGEGDQCGTKEYARSFRTYDGEKYTYTTCALGLSCTQISSDEYPESGKGRCSSKPGLYESCDQAKGCAKGLFCVRNVGTSGGDDAGVAIGVCAETCSDDSGCPKCGGQTKGCCRRLLDVPVSVCGDPT